MDQLLTTGENVDANELAEVWATALASLADGTLTPQQRAFVNLTRPLGIVEDTALIAWLGHSVTASFMRALPRDLEEAAYVDGATPLQVFYKVLLPLIAPHFGPMRLIQASLVLAGKLGLAAERSAAGAPSGLSGTRADG